jgi:hypothetical protein
MGREDEKKPRRGETGPQENPPRRGEDGSRDDPGRPLTPDANPIDPRVFGPKPKREVT